MQRSSGRKRRRRYTRLRSLAFFPSHNCARRHARPRISMWPETPRPALHLRRQRLRRCRRLHFRRRRRLCHRWRVHYHSCLRFLDDYLPKGETARQRTEDGQSWSGLQSNNLVQMVREFPALQARRAADEGRPLRRGVRAKAVSYAVAASRNAPLGKPQQVDENPGMRGRT